MKKQGTRNLVVFFIGIMLIAANLRAPITGLGPLVGMIREDTGLSGTVIGLLTTLTLLAFAVLSPLVPKISQRIGMERTIFLSLIVLTIGILIRYMASVTTLFVGTALLGLAIAVGNVLVPTLIKRDFPDRVGLMTGVYSSFMNLWAAVASGIAIPLADNAGLGWHGALAVWAVLAVIAMFIWLPQLRHSTAAASGARKAHQKINLWHSRLAWCVTLFMGFQSFLFYVNITWLPEIMHAQGMSITTAGWMMSLLQMVSLPASLFTPIIASRMRSQRLLVALVVSGFGIGYATLIIGGSVLTAIGVSLIGIAGGAGFSLAVMFFALRTRTVQQAAEMSGMAQSIGYLIAAVGPMLFGLLHDMTNSWTVSYISLFVTLFLFTIFGLGAGKDDYVVPYERAQDTAEPGIRPEETPS
jgi:CP family cyanate transporter-like MFS transporter